MSVPEPNGNGLPHTPGRPGRVKALPKGEVRFDHVAEYIRKGNPAVAFTKAAETLLDRFNDVKAEMGAAVVLKLAIELHKHGLFCEVAQDKTRTAHDEAAYDKFQEYLSGTSDIPIASGLPFTAGTQSAKLDIDTEAQDGSQEE